MMTRKPDSSLKARLAVLGFTDLQLGGKHTVVTRHASIQSRCENGLFVRGSWEFKNCIVNGLLNCHKRRAWNTIHANNNVFSARVDKSTTRVVGKSRGRHDKSGMENLDNRTVFLGQEMSSDERVYDLAIAYVHDFLIDVDEESADVVGVRELYDWGPREHGTFTQCGVQTVQSCHQGRWRGFSLSCAKYAESLILLDLPSARRKQRDESITAGELSALRGLVGTIYVACNSSDSSVAKTFVFASGIRWSCHGFHIA